LQGRKVGNKSYYSLIPSGKKRAMDGVKRVYMMNHRKWDGLWRIMTCSIPEEKRDLWNQIRKEWTWVGFGPILSSTWVSPNPLEERIMEIIQTFALDEYTMLLSSSSVVSHHHSEVVKKGWDLDESRGYDSFIEQ
jgi:phenylacetic acid degradation operon negative regulatory protein